MQRKAEEACSLTPTLTAAIIPVAKTMGSKNDVLNWIDSVVTTSWVEPQCGDGRCEGAVRVSRVRPLWLQADCNIINSQMNITKIQIDLYYNFSHPKGSVSPIDLMNDAKWNLCPLEMDENIGPKKIFHGADCYYEEDRGFEDQVGHAYPKDRRRARRGLDDRRQEGHLSQGGWRGPSQSERHEGGATSAC